MFKKVFASSFAKRVWYRIRPFILVLVIMLIASPFTFSLNIHMDNGLITDRVIFFTFFFAILIAWVFAGGVGIWLGWWKQIDPSQEEV